MNTSTDWAEQRDSLEDAAELVTRANAIILTAGAGMGVDSGLPDFRGDEGFWRAYPALREAKLGFHDMANPAHFAANPHQAWGFYGHRLALYRDTRPHQGFDLLKKWMESKSGGYSIFTSNVDGQFERAGFASNRLHECHGSIHQLQCTRPCSDATWSANDLMVQIDQNSCTWLGELPSCPRCGALARPNILMFNDSNWVYERSDSQAQLQNDWLARRVSPLVIEIGAGKSVGTVRQFSSRIAKDHKGSLIRINVEKDANDEADVTLAMPALKALQAIERLLIGSSGHESGSSAAYQLRSRTAGVTGSGPSLNAPVKTLQPEPEARTGKKHIEQTLRRRLALLALLPAEARGGGGSRIGLLTEKLQEAGYRCVRRTVERDLVDILDAKAVWLGVGIEIVPQIDPDHAHGRLWARRSHSKMLTLGLPSSESSLLIGLLVQELQAFLPASTLHALSAYQRSPDQVLQQLSNSQHSRYRQKICSLPDGPPRCPPHIDAAYFHEINEALLREEQIDMRYHASSLEDERDYKLHPIGLVRKGMFFWLLAAKEELGKILAGVSTFRIDRVRSIQRRVNDPVSPQLPLLADVLNSGVLEFLPAGQVGLLLQSAPGTSGDGLIKKYIETPFGADQHITALEHGGYQLRATVGYSRELVWALQGQAHLLRVVEPASLRHELECFAIQAAAWYAQKPALPIESGPCSEG